MTGKTEKTSDILDVLIIGGGFAGLCAAIKLKERGETNFVLVEKDSDIGGTWLTNRYPGAACDIPSHFYCYSFAPNPNWSRKYAQQEEILAYIHKCADEYDVRRFFRLNTKVDRLTLNEAEGHWSVTFSDGRTQKARHIINGMGGLHKPSIPDFKGLERFTGPVMHSAQWDRTVDFADKTVAVIGSAASAIQIIPELEKTVSTLKVYQRTPNYVTPRMDRDFTVKEKARFQKFPLLARLYRWSIFKRLDLVAFPLTKQGSWLGKLVMSQTKKTLKTEFSDVDLVEALTPTYTVGCKRILLSDEYYAALKAPNVSLITNPIMEITETGIRTQDETDHPADIIVMATGFDLQGHMQSIDIVGRGGISLADLGPDGEVAYKGATHSQFPNFYFVTGANTGVGTTSIVHIIETQIAYILQLISKVRPGQMIAVKEEAMDAYNDKIQGQLSKSVWASGCDSWYLRGDGKNVLLYPGNAKQFASEHAKADMKDYDLIDASA